MNNQLYKLIYKYIGPKDPPWVPVPLGLVPSMEVLGPVGASEIDVFVCIVFLTLMLLDSGALVGSNLDICSRFLHPMFEQNLLATPLLRLLEFVSIFFRSRSATVSFKVTWLVCFPFPSHFVRLGYLLIPFGRKPSLAAPEPVKHLQTTADTSRRNNSSSLVCYRCCCRCLLFDDKLYSSEGCFSDVIPFRGML